MPAGYKVRGIAPHELRNYPDSVKLMWWSWVVDYGLKAKDRDLARGLDAVGEPLRPIAPATRKNRRSEMTPTGKGDPSAPPLMPGRKLSRTRSLLAGRAFTTHAEFYWRYDAWTGDTWAVILTYHKRMGRDVFGLSEDSLDLVRRQCLARWMKWKREGAAIPTGLEGKRVLGPAPGKSPPIATAPITPYGTTGIHVPAGVAGPRGPMTESELRAYYRAPASANVQARPGAGYNRLLAHVWGGDMGPTAGGAVVPIPPTPIRPTAAPAVTVAEAEAALGVKFAPNHVAKGNKEYTTVVLDVAKVEADVRKDADKYVAPGGLGAAIRGRYEQFMRFLTRAKTAPEKTPIEQPRATIAADTGDIAITDGRHRFAVFRDLLARWLPFSVHRSAAAKMRKKYGATK